MIDALRAVRSFASMLLVGAYFVLGSIVLRFGAGHKGSPTGC